MLRVFAISPSLLALPRLPGDGADGFKHLIKRAGEGQSPVSIVVPRDELRSLELLIDRSFEGDQADRLREIFLNLLSDDHPGIVPCKVSGDGSFGRLVQCARLFEVDAVITGDLDRDARLFNQLGGLGEASLLGVAELEETLDSQPKDVALGKCADESGLAEQIRAVSRLRSVLKVIDPYVGANAVASLDQHHKEAAALLHFCKANARLAERLGQRARVQIVYSESKLRLKLKRQNEKEEKKKKIDKQELLGCAAQIRKRFEELLREVGCSGNDLDVRVAADDFNDRGVFLSGRYWELRHNLEELGNLIRSFKSNPRKRSDYPILSTLGPSARDAIRDLVAQSSAVGSEI